MDPRQPQDTRARILAATEALSCALGPARISIDAVAARAGVSKGGLLYHFPTKHDLLRALVAEHVEALRRALSVEAAHATGPTDRARAYLRVVRAKLDQTSPPGLFAAIAGDPDCLAPLRDFRRAILADVFGRCPDPDLATVAYFATEGLLHSRLTDPEAQDHPERARIFDTLDRLIAAQKELEPSPA